MDTETQNKIKQLEQKITELENKFKSLTNFSTIPPEIEDAFIHRGFLNISDQELIVYWEGGVGGNAFKEKYRKVKYRNKNEYYRYDDGLKPFTVNVTSNICTSANNGFADGQNISFRTTDPAIGLPGGLDGLVYAYFVLNATQNTFQVTTDGVNPVDITSSGTGDLFAFVY